MDVLDSPSPTIYLNQFWNRHIVIGWYVFYTSSNL